MRDGDVVPGFVSIVFSENFIFASSIRKINYYRSTDISINSIVNSIIKFIYAQIFSRVDICHDYEALNRVSDIAAHVFTRAPLKCKIEPVDADGVKGEWSGAADLSAKRHILFIHGGGFSLFSTLFYREMAGRIALASGARALSFNYRLAPRYPFPAAIDDTVKVYRWLLSKGIQPSRIAVVGDSAGGGLTLSLLHHLRDNKIPLPACAVCISAWADLTLSGTSFEEKKKKDHLMRGNALRDCAANYLQGKDATEPSASPVFGDFSNLPPILFQVGGDEVLLNDSQTAVKKSTDAGTRVELSIWPGMVHDFQLWAKVLPDGRRAIRDIGHFVKKHIP